MKWLLNLINWSQYGEGKLMKDFGKKSTKPDRTTEKLFITKMKIYTGK